MTGDPATYHDGNLTSNLAVDESTLESARRIALGHHGLTIDDSGDVVPLVTPTTPCGPGTYAGARVGRLS